MDAGTTTASLGSPSVAIAEAATDAAEADGVATYVNDWIACGELLRELRAPQPAEDLDDDVARELKHVYEMLKRDRDVADGFTALAMVLFDDGTHCGASSPCRIRLSGRWRSSRS